MLLAGAFIKKLPAVSETTVVLVDSALIETPAKSSPAFEDTRPFAGIVWAMANCAKNSNATKGISRIFFKEIKFL